MFQSITLGLPDLCASYKISLMPSPLPKLERIQQTPSNTRCKERCTSEGRFAKCNERHVRREHIRTMTTRVSPRHAQRHSMSCTCSAMPLGHKCTCSQQVLSIHILRAYHRLCLSKESDRHFLLSPLPRPLKLPASSHAPSPFARDLGQTRSS